ncbi:MAG: AAA family ATPase [Ignisphaera sp.]|nr:AAA family ATPase [Ignisphaera sp.]
MAEFIRHIECPSCGSSDANSLYSDGSTFCFACQKASKGTEGEAYDEPSKEFSNETFNGVSNLPFTKSVRGITPTTYHKYSYGKTEAGDHVINHVDKDGKVVAQKFRYKDKTFSWKGSPKAAVPFGLALWRSGGKRITITEGELDCLAVAEALGCKYPVISVNNGAQGAAKDLKQYIEQINSFDEIVIWFDNDEPGQKGAKALAALFPPGKVLMINSSPYKDANEILTEKGKAAVLQYYYEAKKYSPDGIISGASLDFDTIVNIDSKRSVMTPYPKLNKMLRGLRKGELVTFTAGTGMGKTTIVREIAYDMLNNHKLKIGWVALEENTQRSALGFMSLFLDCPIYMDEERETFDKEKLREAFDTVINNENIHFFDHFGSLDSNNLISKLRYLAVGAEVDFIFLDHISIVISGGVQQENERIAIDNLMTSLRSLAEETGVGICVISHLRKPAGEKGFENGVEVTLSHLRGSGSIAQLSDGVIAIERNQQAEEGSNIGNIRVLKNRYTGETGLAGSVKFYKETGRLLDEQYYHPEADGFADESKSQEDF